MKTFAIFFQANVNDSDAYMLAEDVFEQFKIFVQGHYHRDEIKTDGIFEDFKGELYPVETK